MDAKIKEILKKIFPPSLNEIKNFRIGMGNVIFLNVEIKKDNERVLFYKKEFFFDKYLITIER
jgi:hypothetical protein